VETHQPGAGADKDEGRIERGWRLTQVAWKLIRQDRTMLALALAGIGSTIVFTGLIFYFGGYFSHPSHSGARFALVAVLATYPSVLVGVFFNVALASAASAAFDGDHLAVGEALRHAWGKRGRIALWALISAVVGVLVSQIANRLPGGARLVAAVAGAAWGLATIFVIPILAMEGVGAIDSLKRSTRLVKSRWGEGLTGAIAIGAWLVVAAIPLGLLIGIGGAVARAHPGTGLLIVGVALASLLAISALAAATRQVFAVALYRHAIDAPVGGFSPADLEYPFTPDPARKKRRSWILRIGGGFLVAFAVLCVIVAIFRPDPHTAAEGYFRYYWKAGSQIGVSRGDPVKYDHRRIGEITEVTLDGSYLQVEIHVGPSYRNVVESNEAFPTGPLRGRRLCIGTQRECFAQPGDRASRT
jgi:hypothetical protein